MNNDYTIQIDKTGVVLEVSEEAAAIAGLPVSTLLNDEFKNHLLKNFRDRFDKELDAINEKTQNSGQLDASITGLDFVPRPIKITLQHTGSGLITVGIHPLSEDSLEFDRDYSSVGTPSRLLPVSKRITAICRRAKNKKELLSDAMAVISEITSANCAAVIEWGGAVSDWPIAATTGAFDQEFLKGVFRSSVIGRLARGDVIVKDVFSGSIQTSQSLILIPMIASQSPEGIIILYSQGYSILSAEEQHGLGLLGEIIGMGIRSLVTDNTNVPTEDYQTRAADVEAAIALGRLSAGLAHEINNAVTVLHNNTQQIFKNVRRFTYDSTLDHASKDSSIAVNTIRDLTDALRAFAPEETRELEDTNIIRTVETIESAVRFYGKRGIDVQVTLPDENPIIVKCRSHYLVRSLFLIFVELVESAVTSGKVLVVKISLLKKGTKIDLVISVSAGEFKIPAILLSQLESDGVFARLVTKAGAQLSYTVNEDILSLSLNLPLVSTTQTRKTIQPPPSTSPSATPSRRGTILIVDDEAAIIRSTRRILEQDHDILAAKSGEEALKIIEEHPQIDILLLDVFMVGIDGIQLVKILQKQNSALCDRVVFMTGGASDHNVSKYIAENDYPILEKPINIDALKQLMSDMISAY